MIRSFDNQLSETIQFFTPLTLIVGTNGSGKTTIIECLKYMTTGEMPAGSRTGGAFIHDPKLCGEREVHAQVKLAYNNTAGTKMVAVRNLLLTVKKTTRTTKSLESNLVKYRNGERESVSTRTAELGEMVPKYLGVSKAILEYVIFCHQDDSLWPLSEPGELKKRFDRIFEALKYTKAIENLKALRKYYNIELGKLRIHEENAKQTKNKGEEAKKKTEQLLDEIEKLKSKRVDYTAKIKEAQAKYDEVWTQLNRLSGIVGQLNGKRIEHKSTTDVVERLHRNLKHCKESDEQLQDMLDQHEERMVVLRNSLDEQRARYKEVHSKQQDAKTTLVQRERAVGACESSQGNHEQQLEARETLIKQTARHHNVRGFDLDINNEKVKQFMQRLDKMIVDQKEVVEQARSRNRKEMQQAQSVLNGIDQQKSTLTIRKDNARSTIATNERKITSQQSEIDRIDIDEGGKVTLDSAIEDVQKRLASAKSAFDNKKWNELVQTAEHDIRVLDDEKERLDGELVDATKKAGDSARLDFVRKELKDRQRSLETMTATHANTFERFLKAGWAPQTLEKDYQRVLDQHTAELSDAERQRDGSSREVEQVSFKLRTCSTDLMCKREELKQASQAITDVIEDKPSSLPARLSELEKEREILQGDLASFAKLKQYYKSCIDTAKSHNCCRLCTRGFEDPKASESFLAHLKKLLAKFDQGEVKQNAEDVEAEYVAAKAVQPKYDLWFRLQNTEIPALESQERTLGSQHEQLTSELERQDQNVSERAERKRDVSGIFKTVQTIVKYHSECEGLERQVTELSVKQEDAGLSRGLEQIQDDLKLLGERTRSAKAGLSKATSDRDRARNAIAAMELELRDAQGRLSTAVYQLREKENLGKQLSELKAANSGFRDNIKRIDEQMRALGPELSQAQSNFEEVAHRGEEKDGQVQAELSNLNGSINKLELINRSINDYLTRRGPEQLVEAKSALQQINNVIAGLDRDGNATAKEVEYITEQLRNVDDTKRTIVDNQDYRRNQRALQRISSEIAELETHNAETEKQHYDRMAGKWQSERNRLTAEQSVVIGEMKSKDSQLEGLLEDYETSYKDAAPQYKEAHIRVETTRAAIEDVGRFANALDQAIMEFHRLKMEEINKIIDELWRQTYQGTDVDSILIRSDNENLKGNKTVNYRVCMVKQDAEMDMRGRCSAGQKVLASIIIRLALAECFGVNCGLVALDEPTTNLDQDNIRALAASLAQIIRARRQQRNFQLIVITHDEEFLRYMQCADFTDYYYRVSRNDKQKSVIEKQNIAEVM